MVWPFWIFIAPFLHLFDQLFGLAYILSGIALLFIAFGITGALGANILDYSAVFEILTLIIFSPIFLRLSFSLRRRSDQIRADGNVVISGEKVFNVLALINALTSSLLIHLVTGALFFVTIVGVLDFEGHGKFILGPAMLGWPIILERIRSALGGDRWWWLAISIFLGIFMGAAHYILVAVVAGALRIGDF